MKTVSNISLKIKSLMRSCIYLSIVNLFPIIGFAQTPILNWVKTYQGNSYSYDSSSVMEICEADNSIYIGATTDAHGTANDILIIKRNLLTGDTLWTRRYNGTDNGDDQFVDLVVDQDNGDVYFTGKSIGNGSGYDVVAVKYSSLGKKDLGFRTSINLNKNIDDIPVKIGIDNLKNVFITGTTINSVGDEDIYLGQILSNPPYWFNFPYFSYSFSHSSFLGYKELVNCSKISKNGNIVLGVDIAGPYTSSYIKVYGSYEIGYIGGFHELFHINGPRPGDLSSIKAMDIDDSNNIYAAFVVDTIKGSSSSYVISLLKINNKGKIEWEKTLTNGFPNSNNISVTKVKTDPSGSNTYLLGYSLNESGNYDLLINKFNSAGILQWKIERIGNNYRDNVPLDISFDSNQFPIIIGKSENIYGKSGISVIGLHKNTGDEMFSLNYDLENKDIIPYNLIVDKNNNLIINGVKKDINGSSIINLKYCAVIGDAGEINGKLKICKGEKNVTYSIAPITNAIYYEWKLPSGIIGYSNTNTIEVNVSDNAVSGQVFVKGMSDCNEGKESSLNIEVNEPTLPTIVTSEVNTVTFYDAICNGILLDEGCPKILNQGFCWSISENPTIDDTKILLDPHLGIFSGKIEGLIPGNTYYIRSYATNYGGTSYGEQISFTALGAEEWNNISDIEGNMYSTVTIGSQVWLAENLRTTKFNDGTEISLITNNNSWKNASSAAYCWYSNDIANKKPHGALYNYFTVETGLLCPQGWRVPTYNDWSQLYDFLILNGFNYDGSNSGNKISKALAYISSWDYSSTIGSPGNYDYPQKRNASGFSAIASGARRGDNGLTDYIGLSASWWSNSEMQSNYFWGFGINNYSAEFNKGGYSKILGKSVRCVRNEPVKSIPSSAGKISGKSDVFIGETNVEYTIPKIAGASSYLWILPSGSVGSSSSNMISVSFLNSAVDGYIIVKGVNYLGEGIESSLFITVKSLVVADAGAISGKINVCQGESNLTYQVSEIENASSYLWTLPSGATGNSSTNSIAVSFGSDAVSGEITVKGINTFVEGKSSSLSISILPQPNIFAGNDTIICEGSSIILCAKGGNTYNWDNDVKQNVEFTPSTTKTYTVIGSNGLCQNSDEITVTVNILPSSPLIYLTDGVLFSTVSGKNIWYCNNNILTEIYSNSYTPTQSGDYYAVISDGVCESLPSNIISYYRTDVELINDESNNISIYPNPTSGIFHIDFNSVSGSKDLIIYDITGKFIRHIQTPYNQLLVDLNSVSKGLYFIRVDTEQCVFYKKIEFK
ncbi:MAG: T9SS type A sorting domain-containing protein [Bacteroidales bacterium]|nr:T9SS type A sorting domain-containing protein [Bacteroidales bacterium]